MKRTLLAMAAIATLVAAPAFAATDIAKFEGKWSGTVTKNQKDVGAGGAPTAGATGTPATISFTKSGQGLTGKLTVNAGGEQTEVWAITGKLATWTDGNMIISKRRVSFNELPAWVKKESGVQSTDTFFAYQYDTCFNKDDGSPCRIQPKNPVKGANYQLPSGYDTTGITLFALKDGQLNAEIYYTYASGNKRILKHAVKKTK